MNTHSHTQSSKFTGNILKSTFFQYVGVLILARIQQFIMLLTENVHFENECVMSFDGTDDQIEKRRQSLYDEDDARNYFG